MSSDREYTTSKEIQVENVSLNTLIIENIKIRWKQAKFGKLCPTQVAWCKHAM